ncbi:MAG: crossover junction endodeoxyribonuclease RuvC [Myxococcota bacterium]|jgi:crossover junction endodeoxyribonuclease RuvC
MIVLGVDPGTLKTGYGVVECNPGKPHRYIAHGTIRTKSKEPLWHRLKCIHDAISSVTQEHRPEVLSIEQCFVGKNAQSALKLGHARGVVMIACQVLGADVAEYTPSQIKSAVTGHGRAQKHQVAEMVRIILKLDKAAQEDASDALAAAICHGNTAPFQRRLAAAR